MSQFPESDSPSPGTSIPSSIRKLIRSIVTKAFLTTDGQWTHDSRNAAFFLDSCQAYQVSVKFQLRDVEVYYLFGDRPDSRYDFAVPLRIPLTTS